MFVENLINTDDDGNKSLDHDYSYGADMEGYVIVPWINQQKRYPKLMHLYAKGCIDNCRTLIVNTKNLKILLEIEKDEELISCIEKNMSEMNKDMIKFIAKYHNYDLRLLSLLDTDDFYKNVLKLANESFKLCFTNHD